MVKLLLLLLLKVKLVVVASSGHSYGWLREPGAGHTHLLHVDSCWRMMRHHYVLLAVDGCCTRL